MTIELIPGGYLGIRSRTIKTLNNPHTEAMTRPITGAALEGLNWTQKTQWRVNRKVLDVALDLRRDGIAAPGLPGPDGRPLPPRLADSEYEALTKDERVKLMRDLEELRGVNAVMAGTRSAVYRKLDVARDMAQFPAIWFPHFLDFRGRLYPMAQDLHTQGDSMTKGLLEFAAGVPLGQRGKWWLYVATANAFGHDKLPLQERVDWTENNIHDMLVMSSEPLAALDLWATDAVDSPWEALALAFEVGALARWEALGNSPEDFLSHAPIRLDATCSGIQHLSALMRDTVAARCVNVLPTGKREDIYGEVAKAATLLCAERAAGGDPLALLWLERIKRAVVKRAVMTTPYGVTERGIVDQLVKDGHCNFVPNGKERYDAASYLKDLIVGALDVNIGKPREAMLYFQSVAKHLAETDTPLIWDTPSGFTVRQGYFELGRKEVKTLHGSIILTPETPEAGLVGTKQRASAAPNVVHSFDAAHLSLTAVALKHQGIRDLAFVHDSFGTHAGNTDVLARSVREEFISMYSRPALHDWRESVIKHTGVEDIPEVPTLGELDVSCVRDSEFFFS